MGDDDGSGDILRIGTGTTQTLSPTCGPLLRDRRGTLMDDISAIAGLTASLRAAVEIMKAMNDISDAKRDHVRPGVRTRGPVRAI